MSAPNIQFSPYRHSHTINNHTPILSWLVLVFVLAIAATGCMTVSQAKRVDNALQKAKSCSDANDPVSAWVIVKRDCKDPTKLSAEKRLEVQQACSQYETLAIATLRKDLARAFEKHDLRTLAVVFSIAAQTDQQELLSELKGKISPAGAAAVCAHFAASQTSLSAEATSSSIGTDLANTWATQENAVWTLAAGSCVRAVDKIQVAARGTLTPGPDREFVKASFVVTNKGKAADVPYLHQALSFWSRIGSETPAAQTEASAKMRLTRDMLFVICDDKSMHPTIYVASGIKVNDLLITSPNGQSGVLQMDGGNCFPAGEPVNVTAYFSVPKGTQQISAYMLGGTVTPLKEQ